METTEISPFTNNWFNVHNFTPETGSFTINKEETSLLATTMLFVESVDEKLRKQETHSLEKGVISLALKDKFCQFLLTAPHKLSFMDKDSFFFLYNKKISNNFSSLKAVSSYCCLYIDRS